MSLIDLMNKENIEKNNRNVILITGGAGYIGTVLIPILLNQGYKVRLFDNFMFGLKPLACFINHPNLEIVIGDIRKNEDIQKIKFDDVDSVVHLAAIVGDPACAVQGDVAVETNFIATTRIINLCKTHKINKFVFVSSCSVYGAKENEILNENSELNPLSLYAETKIDSEKQILALLDQIPAPVILRFGTIYGLSPRARFDLVVNFFTKKAIKDKNIKIFGGNQWRPFIHVYDISKAIELVLKAPVEKVKKQIFNVGDNNENYQMRQIGEIIREIFPETNVEVIEEVKDKRSYNVSFDKIRDVLNFKASKTIKDGILEIKEAIENGTIKDPDDPIYYNYHVPKEVGTGK
jgi:nucleoside-diphosphate-sugar epimerase